MRRETEGGVPPESDKRIGRAIFTGREQKKAVRGNVPWTLFRPQQNHLSVDRLDGSDLRALTRIHDLNAARRPGPFRGWATLAVADVDGDAWRIQPDPTPENPHHMLMVVCGSVPPGVERDDWVKQRAMALAAAARRFQARVDDRHDARDEPV